MMEVVCEGDLYRVRDFDADTVKRLGEGGGGDDVRSFISQARVRARAGVRVRVNLTL